MNVPGLSRAAVPLTLCIGVGLYGLAGCASSNQQTTGTPAERVDQPAAGTAERPSNLSYGAVTATVKKNVTTQSELIEIFGGPNISTVDKEGVETWVYERTSSMTDSAGSSEQKHLEAFFAGGVAAGPAAAGGGVAGGTRSGSDQRRTVNSVRTLTVVIKFNADRTVKDFSARASYF